MGSLRIAASLCSFVSLLLLIIARATEYWVVDSQGAHSGLWQECANDVCVSYDMDVQDYIYVTRALMLMGMLAGAASFIGLFDRAHFHSISTTGLAVTAGTAAGLCTLIAMSVFTGGVYIDRHLIYGTSFGWSFILGWASFPLFLITSGLAFFIVPSTTEKYYFFDEEPEILESEVKAALEAIRRNKEPGVDRIPIELLQATDMDIRILTRICQQIWKTKQWPTDRKCSVYIPIPKKGDAKECSNYQTIV